MGDLFGGSSSSSTATTTNQQVGVQGGSGVTIGVGAGAFSPGASNNKNQPAATSAGGSGNLVLNLSDNGLIQSTLSAVTPVLTDAIAAGVMQTGQAAHATETAALSNAQVALSNAQIAGDSVNAVAQTAHDAFSAVHDVIGQAGDVLVKVTDSALQSNSDIATQAVNYANINTSNALSALLQTENNSAALINNAVSAAQAVASQAAPVSSGNIANDSTKSNKEIMIAALAVVAIVLLFKK